MSDDHKKSDYKNTSNGAANQPAASQTNLIQKDNPDFWQKKKAESTSTKPRHPGPPPQPFINLPPVTKWMSLGLVVLHLGLTLFLSRAEQYEIYLDFGVVPAVFLDAPFSVYNLFSLVSYFFLHGSSFHLILNTVMLVAFGAGVERWLGARALLIIIFGSSLIAAAMQIGLDPASTGPVIGASGGISGLFASVLVLLYKRGLLGRGKYGLWPAVFFWIGISIVFGLIGSPDGNAVAWGAHIGGFLGGFLMFYICINFIPRYRSANQR